MCSSCVSIFISLTVINRIVKGTSWHIYKAAAKNQGNPCLEIYLYSLQMKSSINSWMASLMDGLFKCYKCWAGKRSKVTRVSARTTG